MKTKRPTSKADPNVHVSKKIAGGTTGALVGAAVAGPIGAVVGGLVGTAVGAVATRGSINTTNLKRNKTSPPGPKTTPGKSKSRSSSNPSASRGKTAKPKTK